MKHSISSLLTFFLLSQVLSGQSPLYLEFNPACINQLEYHYTYSDRKLLMYSIPKGDNELYFFVIGSKEPATSPRIPTGTVDCRNEAVNATLIDNINAGGRLAYIVFKAQNGYLSYQIETAGYIARSGTYFAFRSPNYDFIMDTSSIDYARNLSRPGVASPVYLTGRRSQECQQLYAFRLEPATPESPRADVEVIPGIGVISDRTGFNGSEMEQNIYRLMKVNGIGLEDYIYAACNARTDKETEATSFITNLPSGAANPNDAFRVENPFVEPDKEAYYTQPPRQNNTNRLVNCPTPPGYGYHVVQPGDSLYAIARTYNVDTRLLMQWNNLQNAAQVKVCDKLWVTPPPASESPAQTPPAAGFHVVQKGETLYGIAKKYKLSEATIRQYNNFPATGTATIIPGQRLVVTNDARLQPSGTGTKAQHQTQGSSQTSYVPNSHPGTQTSNPAQYIGEAPSGPGPGASAERMIYKSKKGESLASVAWNYGYTVPFLRHINRSNRALPAGDNDLLPEGSNLVVSDGKGKRDDLSGFNPPAMYSSSRPGVAAAPAAAAAPKSLAETLQQPPQFTGGDNYEFVGEYIVQSGDTVDSIARRYGLAPEKLAAANKLKSGQQPAPRSIIRIPK